MRKLIAGVGALALSLSLVACSGGNAKNTENNAEADSGKQVGVVTWWSAGSEKEGFDALAEVFKTQHPDVELIKDAASGGGGTNAKQKLAADLAAKNPPDTYQSHAGAELSSDIAAGYVEDVSNLYDEFGLREAFPADLVDRLSVDGGFLAARSAANFCLAVADIKKMIVWGNHSADQYPDISFVEVAGKPAQDLVEAAWLEEYFVPTVAKRGAAIIEARGASSAASAASAAIDHMHSWACGTPAGDWTTSALPSKGEYGVPEGLMYGMPVTSDGTDWSIVEGLEISDLTKEKIAYNAAKAQEEIDAVKSLGLL